MDQLDCRISLKYGTIISIIVVYRVSFQLQLFELHVASTLLSLHGNLRAAANNA